MSTTSSTVATLVGDVAEAPAKLHAKKPSIHSTVPIQTNSPNCRSVPSLTTTPLRPSLKRSVTSGSQRRSIPSKVHVDTRAFSGLPALDTPRSFQQLYDEQAYLLASRVMEEQRSRELMRRLATLQENPDGECPSSQSRKSKKQSSLLKAKLLRAAEQEKAIMGRLGEVFVEVQTRQRWMQAQQERHVTSSWTPTPWAVWETVASPISGLMTPIVLTPTCAPLVVPEPLVGAQLDAKSPEFVPGVPFLFPTNGPGQQGYGCTSEADCDVSPLAMLGTDGLNLESFGKADLESLGTADLGDALGNRGLEFEFEGVETPGETEPTLQKAKACRGGRQRRMSLPGLRCVWPGSGVEGTFEDNEWNTQHRPEQPHHVEDVEL